MPKVLCITAPNSIRQKILEDNGFEVIFCKKDNEEIIKLGADADAMIFENTVFDNELFDKLPSLKILSRSGIGIDTVDIDAATAHGVVVCNCPGYGAYDVAQHTVALMLSLIHSIPRYDSAVKDRNDWSITGTPMSTRLSDRTLGIIGFGRISRWICRMLQGFGMSISVYDPYVDTAVAKELGVTPVSLDTLLVGSDIISVNAPLNASTHHMINAQAFEKMRDGVFLINTSRGGLIDTNALISALDSGKVKGAALDVFEEEPFEDDCRLRSFKNVVTTPHVAWNSTEAVRDLNFEVTDNIIDFFNGKPLKNQLNMK